MDRVLMLMALQGAMGAFDTLYHHEVTEHLTWRRAAVEELRIHALRNVLYAALFLVFAWSEWRGSLAALIGGIMAVELVLTLVDFLIEDSTRDLPPTERVTHTLLALNYGMVVAFLRRRCGGGQPSRRELSRAVTASSHGSRASLPAALSCGACATGAALAPSRARSRRRRYRRRSCRAGSRFSSPAAPASSARASPKCSPVPATASPC
jgi:hypothetical protein